MRTRIVLMAVAFCFSGCLEFSVLVKVNRDGSGTIEQTFLLNRQMVRQLKEITENMDRQSGTLGKGFDLVDREKLFREAETMGKGVRYSSVTRMFTHDKEGYTARYAFDDINTVSINENPQSKTQMSHGAEKPRVKKELMTFSFRRGTPATLVIRSPKEASPPKREQQPKEETGAKDTTGLATVMEMFKGFRMAMAVQCAGSIVQTNATYVDTNRVTLMEFDFEQLLHDREKFEMVSEQKPQTVEEMKQLLKQIPGIKVELAQEIVVRFQ